MVKGRVVTINLVKMMLRFLFGNEACQVDLKQFYASIKLIVEQWNLQRVLMRDELDPGGKILELILRTLIWGLKCVSAGSRLKLMNRDDTN